MKELTLTPPREARVCHQRPWLIARRQILRPVLSRISRAALFLATSLLESDNGSAMVTVPCGPKTFILPAPARSTSPPAFWIFLTRSRAAEERQRSAMLLA